MRMIRFRIQEKSMRNRIKYKGLILAALCAVSSIFMNKMDVSAAEYWPNGPDTESPCIVVIEQKTGTVLYEKNSHEQHYPASITKIMTSMLALDQTNMDDVVTFSEDAIYKTEGSSIYRDVGEQMTMEECLYALMLASSNDCAYAVAEHVSGSMEGFVGQMNEKAKELGCTDTHFANPHGLTDPEHYTTCYDMALIAREAYKSAKFRMIIGTARYTIPPTNKHDEETYLQNHNEMLYPFRTLGEYKYEYCTGGKTGYTQAANSTLVTFAEKDGMTLICVVMNTVSPSQWKDSINLYNYCFDNFQILNVSDHEERFSDENKDVDSLNVNEPFAELDKEGVIVLPKTAEFSEATPEISYENKEDNVIASLKYTFAGREVGEANIITTGAKIESFLFRTNLSENETENSLNAGGKGFHINVVKVILVIIGLLAFAALVYLIKVLADNFYIIKHRLFGNRENKRRYRTIKDTRKHRRKRWFRRR